MNKLSYLKSARQRLRDDVTYSKNIRMHTYEDVLLKEGNKVQFKHSWANLAHMHDLRVWTLAYAPYTTGSLQRLQEIHRLNSEMWYLIGESLWKRFFVGVFLWFFINKIAKAKYMNRGKKDSHDVSYRDTVGHM